MFVKGHPLHKLKIRLYTKLVSNLVDVNVYAMDSAGIKSSKLSIKHLAKTFYFIFFVHKAKSKDLADLV